MNPPSPKCRNWLAVLRTDPTRQAALAKAEIVIGEWLDIARELVRGRPTAVWEQSA